MSLADVVRNAVATANRVTAGLQPAVTYRPYLGQDYRGTVTLGDPVPLQALVDETVKPIYVDGKMVMCTAYIALLQPLPPTTGAGVAADRVNPIDQRDQFTLPSGRTAPIVKTTGFVDAGTGAPYFHEVYLGQ